MTAKLDTASVSKDPSLFKTVDRDDLLVARAANPRTGLITPAATSISGSNREGYVGSTIDVTQSAQWALHNNQWVSVERHTNLGLIEESSQGRAGAQHQPLGAPSSIKSHPLVIAVHNDLPVTHHETKGSANLISSPTETLHQTIGRKAVGSHARDARSATDSVTRPYENAHVGITEGVTRQRLSSVPIPAQLTIVKNGATSHDSSVASGGRTSQAIDVGEHTTRPWQGGKRGKSCVDTDRLLAQCIEDGPYPATLARRQYLRSHGSAAREVRSSQHEDLQTNIVQHRGMRRVYRQPTPPWLGPRGPLTGPRDIAKINPYVSPGVGSNFRDPVYTRYHGGEIRSLQPILEASTRSFSQSRAYTTTHTDTTTAAPRRQSKSLEAEAQTAHGQYPATVTASSLRLDASSEQDAPTTQLHAASDRPSMPSRKMGMLPVPTVAENSCPVQGGSSTTVIDTGSKCRAVSNRVLLEQIDLPNVGHSPMSRRDSSAQLPVPAVQLVRAATAANDHSRCCGKCCRDHDCHDGCLGHIERSKVDTKAIPGSDQASISSLENSIKNLHEFNAQKASKIAKLRAIFTPSPRDELVLTPFDMLDEPPASLKQSLREKEELFAQTILARRAAEQAKKIDPNVSSSGALNAAKIVMDAYGCPETRPKGPRIEEKRRAVKKTGAVAGGASPTMLAPPRHTANASKRVMSRHEDTTVRAVEELVESQDPGVSTKKRFSFSSTLSDVYAVRLLLLRERYPILNETASVLLDKILGMSSVMFTTTSTLMTIVFDYSRTGILQLPGGVTGTALIAGCGQSILYLMICAGVMASILRLLGVVVAVLRIILLPVKIVAWIIG